MTVIQPNSISGVSSITGNGGDISIFRADGTAADVTVNNITSGVITATTFKGAIDATTGTFSGNLGVGGVLTYEDVTNVDSVGVITARIGLRVPAGEISLGTGTPRQKLHINASDSGAANMVFTNTTTGTAAGDGFVVGITGGEDAQLNMQESANIKFSTADTERLRITSAGKLGVGVASPVSILHLHEAGSDGAPIIQFSNGDTGTTTGDGFAIGMADNESPFIYNRENTDLRIATNNTERFRIGSSGQFGIGGATYGTSGQVLTSGGASAAPTWGTISAAAGSVYDTFHGQGFSSQSGNGYYTSGWGKPGGPGGSWANGPSGKRITESSGIFSFPSTGIYYISHRLQFSGQNINMRIGGNRIYGTNSNANPPAHALAEGQCNINSFSGTSNGYGWAAAFCECIVKITNTTNDKVAFWWQSSEASNIGSGVGNMVVFFKIADLN